MSDPEHVILVDLGSNAVRLAVAAITPGVGFRILGEARRPVRLGGGADGLLPAAAVMETRDAVRRFLRAARARGPCRAVAIATAAVREAGNAASLLRPLRDEEGLEVVVLSPHEEATLGALAVRTTLPLSRAVVVDLGGGSLQVTEMGGPEIDATASYPLGTLRAQRFLVGDPPRGTEIEALRKAVRETAGACVPPARATRPLVALGGTARALGRLAVAAWPHRAPALHGLRLGRGDVAVMTTWLARLRQADRRRVNGLKRERADIIVAGLIVIDELLALGGYPGLTLSAHGVRHGFLIRETFAASAEGMALTPGTRS